MKNALSLLVAYTFLQSQMWALTGGPNFGGNGTSVNVVGTFSGVLLPEFQVGINVDTSEGANSIGIFSVGVPQVGIATGTFAFFGNAQAYNGTITGVADPDKGTLKAILDAPTTLRVGSATTTTGGTASATFEGQAIGKMEADIIPSETLFSPTESRLEGSAHLDVFEGDFNADLSVKVASTFDFVVDGFKQSTNVSASSVSVGSGTTP
jgi:hypothetical protein